MKQTKPPPAVSNHYIGTLSTDSELSPLNVHLLKCAPQLQHILYHSGLFYTMIVLSEYCPKKKKQRAISSCGVAAQSGEAELVRSNRSGGKTGVGRAEQHKNGGRSLSAV